MTLQIGIDLGGTKIEIIALDQQGQTLARERVPTPSGNYTAIIQTLVNLIQSVEQRLGTQGHIGIATSFIK